MRFTVTWQHDAEEKLAAIWAATHDRQAIADAANQIDRLPRLDGDRVGVEFLNF